MFCVIYRSSKRDQTYLYVEKKDDFSRVPEELMKGFGQKICSNSIWQRPNKIHQTLNVKLHPAAARSIDAVPEIYDYVRGK